MFVCLFFFFFRVERAGEGKSGSVINPWYLVWPFSFSCVKLFLYTGLEYNIFFNSKLSSRGIIENWWWLVMGMLFVYNCHFNLCKCSIPGRHLYRGSVQRCCMQHQRIGSEGSLRAFIMRSRQPIQVRWILKFLGTVHVEQLLKGLSSQRILGSFFYWRKKRTARSCFNQIVICCNICSCTNFRQLNY